MGEFSYTIREMARHEVGLAIDWAAGEGWNPGLHDAECFYGADPHGFMIGLVNNLPVAVISAIRYSDSFGFIGFFIVRKGYRGKNYGPRIGNAAMNYLKGCTVGLDGVVAKQSNYLNAGFKIACRNIRFQGLSHRKFSSLGDIISLREIPFDELCRYDNHFFPANRQAFLNCWIHQPESYAVGYYQNGDLAGYGVIRTCRSGFKVGPLFADSPAIAETLWRALNTYPPEDSAIFLDIPDLNHEAADLVVRYKMSPVFETVRMYSGPFPDLPVERIFGITTFELG